MLRVEGDWHSKDQTVLPMGLRKAYQRVLCWEGIKLCLGFHVIYAPPPPPPLQVTYGLSNAMPLQM